jgi:PAS domain S-box-containing protein
MTIPEPDALRLAAIVKTSDDAIISHSLDGIIESWNPAAERMFGYVPAEAIGRHIEMMVSPDRRDDEQQLTEQLRQGGTVHHFESCGLTKQGLTIPLSLALSPLITQGGEIIGVARIARDITRDKAAERDLARLVALVDSADDAIVSKDLQGIVQTWNPAAEKMFGYEAAEIIGRSITTIIPADRQQEEGEVLSRIRQGQRVEHFETVRQRKDGRLIEVSLTVSPIRTTAGLIVGASKIAREITWRKRLEREAWRLAAIVESSDDAIASKDLNGIVQTWNPAAERLFGYTADEIIGKPIATIIPDDLLPEEAEVLRRIRTGKSVDHFETLRRHKSGRLIQISLTVSPILGPGGEVIGASKIARDISEQRRLARAAEEANRVKDEFLAMLSHELRTPLNAVLGYTRMLRSGHMSEDKQERAIDTIERNANILSQLVSDVLDVSAIVTGKVQLKASACDLTQIVEAAADVVRPSAEAKELTLRVQVPERPITVHGDSDRLQQVFWNLLVNAVKFTPTGGRIDMRLDEVPGRHARLIVSDTGCGIRPESLPHIFQRFWQGEHRADGTSSGLGLGLSLARHFTELHGGTISVSSEGEGHGTTFTVTLPLLRSGVRSEPRAS